MKMKTEPKYKPGTVVPSVHDDEWTFTYFLSGLEITHEEWGGHRTFKSAARAKQAMRDFIEDMNR